MTIAMFDKSGNALGSCSGTLVAKDVVLTAGHCAAGAAKWSIDARGADATSEATRAVTPWKAFGSDLSHPDHSDVALLILDKPIVLDAYPAVATSKLSDGAKALRFSRTAATATEPASTEISVSGMSKKGFRLNYAAKVEKSGFVDTGGAIIDPKTGKIHGVVSGIGNESGLLHIARTDNFAKWIANARSCTSATSLATRTYGTSSGGSSGWGSTSSSGGAWPSGGDWGGYGGSGDKLDGGGSSSGSSGMDGGAGSSGSSGTSSSGSSGTAGSSSGSAGSSSGSSGSSGSAGGGDTSGAGSSCPGVPTCEGSDCPGVPGGGTPGTGSSGSSGASGSDGTNGSSSGSSGASSGSSGASSGSSGASSGSSGASGSDGTNGGGDEVCPGPPNCPEPDSQACSGAACGGCGGVAGCVDATIDYGSCASCGTPSGTGTPPVVR